MFKQFTMELLFEFRHWEIVAKVIYWRNQDIPLEKLVKYIKSIDLSDCYPFPMHQAYGKKRLTRIIKVADKTDFFENYEQFDNWIFECKKAFEKMAVQVSDEGFEVFQ